MSALQTLSDVYLAQSRYADAEAVVTRALTVQENLLGSADPRLAPSLLIKLARAQRLQGRDADAERTLGRALRIAQSAAPPIAPSVLREMAELRRVRERWADAEFYYRQVVVLFEAREPPEPVELASVLASLADIVRRQGGRPGGHAAARACRRAGLDAIPAW